MDKYFGSYILCSVMYVPGREGSRMYDITVQYVIDFSSPHLLYTMFIQIFTQPLYNHSFNCIRQYVNRSTDLTEIRALLGSGWRSQWCNTENTAVLLLLTVLPLLSVLLLQPVLLLLPLQVLVLLPVLQYCCC